MVRLSFRSRRSSQSGSKAGKVGATLFLSLFLAVGLVATGAVIWGWLQAVDVYLWDEVECVIETSAVEEQPGSEPYRFVVTYRYSYGGREYAGDRLDGEYTGSSSASRTQRLADRYAPGTVTSCRVDPDQPDSAYLRRPALWFGFFVLATLVFVAVGGGGIYFLWRPRAVEAQAESAAGRQAISERAGRSKVLSWAVFSWVFFLAGAGFSLFFVLPAIRVVQARWWHQVPCEILQSSVSSHSSDDGVTYSVEVLYRYEIAGREYKSSRFRFLGGSSSGHQGKQEVVDRLPPGAETTCYVNPDDPYDAVLNRNPSWPFLFAFLPLVFVAIGGPGAALSVYRGVRKLVGAAEPAVETGLPEAVPAGRAEADAYLPASAPAVLEAQMGPIGKFLMTVFFCLFWNGIVGVFLWFLIEEWRQGTHDWFVAVILAPFVLVGIVALISVPYQLLALANPRPHLTLTPGSVPVGGSARLDWRFSRAAGRLRGLRIVLEGREAATYGRGTRSVTDTEVFATTEAVGAGGWADPRRGSAHFDIPADTMHSFDADHNKIEWVLKLEGEIPFWPDVSEEFKIRVIPPTGATG